MTVEGTPRFMEGFLLDYKSVLVCHGQLGKYRKAHAQNKIYLIISFHKSLTLLPVQFLSL